MRQIICYPFIGDSVGGAHLSTIELIKNLDCQRYQPLIVLHENGPLAEYLNNQNIAYFRLSLKTYAGSCPNVLSIAKSAVTAAPTLQKFLSEKSISLVHCNDLRTNLTWMLACRLAGARCIWHQRTQTNSDSFLWRIIPWLIDHFIANSATAARSFGKAGSRVSIIANPFANNIKIDRDIARDTLIKEICANENDCLIGFVGRLVKSKRPEICIELLGELLQRGESNLRLIIFGHGSDAALGHLHQLCSARGLEDKVHFMGFRNPIEQAIAGLDVLVAPSEQEGFGRTLIEAMLVGTPVVASKIDAHQETIKDKINGLLADVGSVTSFANATQSLLHDQVWATQLVNNASKMAGKRFSSEKHALQVQNIYAELLKNKA